MENKSVLFYHKIAEEAFSSKLTELTDSLEKGILEAAKSGHYHYIAYFDDFKSINALKKHFKNLGFKYKIRNFSYFDEIIFMPIHEYELEISW